MKRRQQRDAGRCELQRLSVLEFFADEGRWDAVRSYITGPSAEEEAAGEAGSRVSLRLIDYFVTNYARKFLCEIAAAAPSAAGGTVSGTSDASGANRTHSAAVSVYQSVQNALRGLNKKRMDPFCRRHAESDKIELRGVQTNVAQLSFFRWALINGVLQYIEQHAPEIRADMKEVHLRQKDRRWAGARAGAALLLGAAPGGIAPTERSVAPLERVVIQIPEGFVEENPGDLERLRITLQEKMHQPRRKRKRLNEESAVEVVSRVAARSGGGVFQTGAMRL
jgi:hypothetical protein